MPSRRGTDFNLLEITGRCGCAPDYRVSARGSSFLRFTVACEMPGYPAAEDTKPMWLDVTVFGAGVSVAKAQNLQKGDLVRLRGKLVVQEWTQDIPCPSCGSPHTMKRSKPAMVAFHVAVGHNELPPLGSRQAPALDPSEPPSRVQDEDDGDGDW